MHIPGLFTQNMGRREQLNLLHYAPKALKSGFIDEAFLERQVRDYLDGVDWRTEHYRHEAFARWIDARQFFTEEDLDLFVYMVEVDERGSMAFAAATRLLRKRGLTDDQFERLAEWIGQSRENLRYVVEKVRYQRELSKLRQITEAEFRRYVMLHIPEIDEYLLARFAKHEPALLSILEEWSVSRRVFDIARKRREVLFKKAG